MKRVRTTQEREEVIMKDLASLETCCWYKKGLVTVDDGGREAWHISTSAFFKGGKPEVSAGGEDAFKARTAIHKRSHWRWKLRIRYRHTSIRKSAKTLTTQRTKCSPVTQEPFQKIFPPPLGDVSSKCGVATRTMIFQRGQRFCTLLKDARFSLLPCGTKLILPVYYSLFSPSLDRKFYVDFITFALNFNQIFFFFFFCFNCYSFFI